MQNHRDVVTLARQARTTTVNECSNKSSLIFIVTVIVPRPKTTFWERLITTGVVLLDLDNILWHIAAAWENFKTRLLKFELGKLTFRIWHELKFLLAADRYFQIVYKLTCNGVTFPGYYEEAYFFTSIFISGLFNVVKNSSNWTKDFKDQTPEKAVTATFWLWK